MKGGVTRAIVLLLALLLANCGDIDEIDTLRIGHTADISHPVHQALQFFAEDLATRSSGALTARVYPGGQLGSEREMIELLQVGALDMTKVSASPLEGFAEDFRLFSMPYIFVDREHFWRVLDGELGRNMLTSLTPMRLRGLGYFDAGSRSFYTTQRPVRDPGDLDGQKIRVMSSATAIETVDMLGGAPTPLGWGELYSSLQQGVVDGAENNPPSYLSARHYEVAPFYTLDEHTSIPDLVLIGTSSWDRLDARQREWVAQSMAATSHYQRQIWLEAEQAAMAQLRAEGVTIIEPDKQAFMARVAEMHARYGATAIGPLLEQVRQAQR